MVAVMWMQIVLLAKCCCFLLGTNTQCIERSLLLYCITSTVYLMYSMHKQMFVTTTTFYALRTLMIAFAASLCSLRPSVPSISVSHVLTSMCGAVHCRLRTVHSSLSTVTAQIIGTATLQSSVPGGVCVSITHTAYRHVAEWVSFLGICVGEEVSYYYLGKVIRSHMIL